jgi:uncharacterized membrane protein YgdD (TMEM256/DUF423 family)
MFFSRLCIAAGGLAGAGAVAMAAVAAHGLGALTPAALAAVRSGIEMEGWHALALIALAGWLPRGGFLARLAACGFVAGIILFCGGIFGHEIGGFLTGALAPIGGTILIVSWLLLAGSALRRER